MEIDKIVVNGMLILIGVLLILLVVLFVLLWCKAIHYLYITHKRDINTVESV